MINDAPNFIKIWRLDFGQTTPKQKNKDKRDQPDAQSAQKCDQW